MKCKIKINVSILEDKNQLDCIAEHHRRKIPINNAAKIRSKSIEKCVLVVKIVLSLRGN